MKQKKSIGKPQALEAFFVLHIECRACINQNKKRGNIVSFTRRSILLGPMGEITLGIFFLEERLVGNTQRMFLIFLYHEVIILIKFVFFSSFH